MPPHIKFIKTFAGKKIFITGDSGFKGSWLALWLHSLGAELLGFSLPPEHENGLFRLAGIDEMIKHIDGDIRDFDLVRKTMADFAPDLVFHLAAQALVRKSYQEPRETFAVNVNGTVNILEAIRSLDCVRAAVLITSDKCYKNKEWVWGYRENDELGGIDPYSASKAAAEIVISAYMNSFFKDKGIGISSTRAGNVIGGGDRAQDRIIPDCIHSLENNQPIIIRNPNATRPWQHVLDPLSGYLQLAAGLLENPDRYSGPWNFGPATQNVRTVEEIAQQAVQYWGTGEIKIDRESNPPHEANLLQLNTDKAKIELGWSPRWHVDQSIRETISWYRSVYDGASPVNLCLAQIKKYMELDQ